MLISHNHKLLFVHLQKTGGETVSKLLAETVPDLDRLEPKHKFARQGREEVRGWDEYFKFAFVRNPWDRLVSWYSMIRNAAIMYRVHRTPTNRRQESHIRQVRQNRLWRYVLDNSSTFEEFIYNCTDDIAMGEGVAYSFTYNQLDYVTDSNGRLLVDFIGRFESFETDLRKVFRILGVEPELVPWENRSSHAHYSLFYTAETKKIVSERFKRDIEYFGYEFEYV